MNCPYCDEGIHPMAKFCPKCGLPLKDDATVMGAYVSDDSGPNPLVIAGGITAILAIVAGLGFLGSRRSETAPQTTRREPVHNMFAPQPLQASNSYSTYPTYGSTGYAAPALSAGPAVNWSARPNYVTPTSQIKFKRPAPPDPLPPEVPLLAIHRARPKAPTRVFVENTAVPAPPSPTTFLPSGSFGGPAPIRYYPIYPGTGYVVPSDQSNAGPAAPAATELTSMTSAAAGAPVAENNQWVWDPVQERYALRADARPSRRQ